MSDLAVGGGIVAGLVFLVIAGLHVPTTLLLLSFVGAWILRGSADVAFSFTAQAAKDAIASHDFGVVPLFVLMGMIVSEARIGHDLFAFAHRLFRNLKGSLGVATVFANALFASITGVSIASAAVFSRVSVPIMMNYGYTASFATGVVAGSSVLGMLIPPSVLMIVYSFLTNQSVGAMFIGGVLPGLLLASVFTLGIVAMAYLTPKFIWAEKRRMDDVDEEPLWILALRLGPVVALVTLMLGGLYAGFFTATEAGAVGAAGALLLALPRRLLTWRSFWRMLIETGHITVSVLFLIICANLYSRTLSLSGLPQEIVSTIVSQDVGALTFVLIYVCIIFLLGCLIDSVSIMLIVVPVMLPVAMAFNLDLVWFGIVTVIAVEVGLLTPPFGIVVYVVRSSVNLPDIGVRQIFAGSAPFFVMMLIVLALVIWFPRLVTAPL